MFKPKTFMSNSLLFFFFFLVRSSVHLYPAGQVQVERTFALNEYTLSSLEDSRGLLEALEVSSLANYSKRCEIPSTNMDGGIKVMQDLPLNEKLSNQYDY